LGKVVQIDDVVLGGLDQPPEQTDCGG